MLAFFVQIRLSRYTTYPQPASLAMWRSPVQLRFDRPPSVIPFSPFTQSAIRPVAVVASNLASTQACRLSSLATHSWRYRSSRPLQQRPRKPVRSLLASTAPPQPGALAPLPGEQKMKKTEKTPRASRRHPLPGLSPGLPG